MTTEPVYCTVAQLKTELEADSITPPTEGVMRRAIEDAEDLIDRLLGGWWWGPDEETGRKIVQGDVMAWQWTKLQRATIKLSARLYRDPSVLEQVYQTVSGPDFSMSGPKGGAVTSMIGVQVLALLDDSGLRRIAARATQGRGRRHRAGFDRFLNATRHNGT